MDHSSVQMCLSDIWKTTPLWPQANEPHKVVTKTGNSVVIESPDGVQLKWNNTHVKKYDERTTLPVDLEPTESATVQETAKFPEKFKDFVMT